MARNVFPHDKAEEEEKTGCIPTDDSAELRKNSRSSTQLFQDEPLTSLIEL